MPWLPTNDGRIYGSFDVWQRCSDLPHPERKQAGRLLTNSDPAVEMSKLQSTTSLLDQPSVDQPETTILHHLLFQARDLAQISMNMPSLSVYLCSRSMKKPLLPLIESFAIKIFSSDDTKSQNARAKHRSLFSV